MSRDVLLVGLSEDEGYVALQKWKDECEGLHDFFPDYHRLQLEHWIWSKRDLLGHDILDIGVENPRAWLGDGYQTFGEHEEETQGDLCNLPFPDASFDGFVLTEVLEHCKNPWGAIKEVHRVIRPGGRLLVTSPFLWPWHGTNGYQDYWRFTHQGWELLLDDFNDVEITPCSWTVEGEQFYHMVRRFEGWGFKQFGHGHTGYLCEAVK